MTQPAIFLDRDGVLNRYLPGDYVKTPDELDVLPGAGEAVARLNTLGYPVYLVSNQQGVAKGLMTDADLRAVDTKLHARVAKAGGTIRQSYYCTHHKDANSTHRKPEPGMILEAARDHDLDLSRSVFVGDTETDAQAARAAGVGTFILVLSGKFAGRPEAATDFTRFPVPPDYICADLPEATDWIATQDAQLLKSVG
ncbi:MAG: HAD family hydrolase [Akkermansiaceae bacterium]|nr:HAD family hydrolase [Armatimonadota bacterium]